MEDTQPLQLRIDMMMLHINRTLDEAEIALVTGDLSIEYLPILFRIERALGAWMVLMEARNSHGS
jgi:hypothetical protein